MAIDPKFADLEAVDAFAVAVNLAYLNLPNLRFADRIKSKIRSVVSTLTPEQRSAARAADGGYKAAYHAGELGEIPGVPQPTAEARNDGDVRVQMFVQFWATPILQQGSLIPFDKVISAVLLTVSSLYLYIIVVAKLGSSSADVIALTKLSIFFVLVPVVLLAVYFLVRKDYWGAGVATVALLYAAYCTFVGGPLAFPVDDPHWALLLLASCAGITTWFVLASFALYSHAEGHYVQVTKHAFGVTPSV